MSNPLWDKCNQEKLKAGEELMEALEVAIKATGIEAEEGM